MDTTQVHTRIDGIIHRLAVIEGVGSFDTNPQAGAQTEIVARHILHGIPVRCRVLVSLTVLRQVDCHSIVRSATGKTQQVTLRRIVHFTELRGIRLGKSLPKERDFRIGKHGADASRSDRKIRSFIEIFVKIQVITGEKLPDGNRYCSEIRGEGLTFQDTGHGDAITVFIQAGEIRPGRAGEYESPGEVIFRQGRVRSKRCKVKRAVIHHGKEIKRTSGGQGPGKGCFVGIPDTGPPATQDSGSSLMVKSEHGYFAESFRTAYRELGACLSLYCIIAFER